jgi:hypothetical protein
VALAAALVAIKPKVPRSQAAIKLRVRLRIKPRAAAVEEPRGNPANPAFPAMYRSNR